MLASGDERRTDRINDRKGAQRGGKQSSKSSITVLAKMKITNTMDPRGRTHACLVCW